MSRGSTSLCAVSLVMGLLFLVCTPAGADDPPAKPGTPSAAAKLKERLRAFAALQTYHVLFEASHGSSTRPDHRIDESVESAFYAARSCHQVLRLEDPDAYKRGSRVAYVRRPLYDSKSGALAARVRWLFESPEALLAGLAKRAGQVEVVAEATNGAMTFGWQFGGSEGRHRFKEVLVKSKFLSGDCAPSEFVRRVQHDQAVAEYSVSFDPAGRLSSLEILFTCPLRPNGTAAGGEPERYAAHLRYRFSHWDTAEPFEIPGNVRKALR